MFYNIKKQSLISKVEKKKKLHKLGDVMSKPMQSQVMMSFCKSV